MSRSALRSLATIKPYPENPRVKRGAVEQVMSLIEEYGFTQPILVDKDGWIIAGHTRYAAAQNLGMKKVPTIILDHLSDAQVKALRIADNKSAEYSEWDWPVLGSELDHLSKLGYDLGLTSFPATDISQILEGFSQHEPESQLHAVNDEQVAKAAGKLAEIGQTGKQSELEVECPSCGHGFFVQP